MALSHHFPLITVYLEHPVVSAPVAVPFLWTLDLGPGFGTWIWDLDLGLGFGTGLGLDNKLKEGMGSVFLTCLSEVLEIQELLRYLLLGQLLLGLGEEVTHGPPRH